MRYSKLLILLVINLAITTVCRAQMTVTAAEEGVLSVAEIIREHFVGKGIRLVNSIRFVGDTSSVGVFNETSGILGIKEGIVMSTGLAEQATGPNGRPNAGANLEGFFFTDEHTQTSANMCDGVVIEFEFSPQYDSVAFDFVFGSDEYPEFVGKDFNDLFAFYIYPKINPKGMPKNIGVLPNKSSINVNNVNHQKNSEWYVANDKHTCAAYEILEWDGYTKLITVGQRVIPNKLYVLKMVIADLTDCEYDSGILFRKHSLRSLPRNPKPVKPKRKEYYFNFTKNDYKLNEVDTKKITQLADSIRTMRLDSIVIIGHTDSTGNEKLNIDLSMNRAKTVAENLQQQLNTSSVYIPIHYRGMGSKKPISSHKTEKGKSLNRRVELLFYTKPSWSD